MAVGQNKSAYRRMLEGFQHDPKAVTQTEVDVLILSSIMTKKCFPKCVMNLSTHGILNLTLSNYYYYE